MTNLRSFKNILFISACVLSLIIALCFMISIFTTLITKGGGAINWQLFFASTPSPGGQGGLANAIVGSLVITTLAILLATPIAILTAVYLVEYGQKRRLARIVQFANDLLLSVPSIIVGLFIFAIVISRVGHYSAYSGALALAIIALPIITRNTEDMLQLVPVQLREAGIALGVPRWRITLMILSRAARPGIITGILLAIARVMGETAPLLFTALSNQFWSLNLNQPMANLPMVIFQYALSPYQSWQQLAWAGALIITCFILITSFISHYFLQARKHS
ncbi:MAG: phosphate ABC transporter permease PstA [Gammaproteobacteria bacterium]